LNEVLPKVENGYRLRPPPYCPVVISKIMDKTWNLDPGSRPTFAEIVLELKKYLDVIRM